jgi:hypothetical protein
MELGSEGGCNEQFEVDGSLRDVCVLGTNVSVWERLLSAVPEVPGGHQFEFELDGEAVPLADFSVRRYFADDTGEFSPTLRLRFGELWFSCFFFEQAEIEFSFGPEDLGGGVHFKSLELFMLWLAEVCDRRVILTMEHSSSHHDAILLLETLA